MHCAPLTVRLRRWIRLCDEQRSDAPKCAASEYSYSPFGERAKVGGLGPDADFGFAGMYHHNRSGLNLTLFRAYSPKLGCWLSPDPLDEIAGISAYSYAWNSPSTLIDPLGLAPRTPWDFWLVGEWHGKYFFPTLSPEAGLQYIVSKHGVGETLNLNKPLGDSKWNPAGFKHISHGLFETIDRAIRQEPCTSHRKEKNLDIYEGPSQLKVFRRGVPTPIKLPVGWTNVDENGVIAKNPYEANGIRVVVNEHGVIIDAYPIYNSKF